MEQYTKRYRFEWIGSARIYCEMNEAKDIPGAVILQPDDGELLVLVPLRGWLERNVAEEYIVQEWFYDYLLDADFVTGALTVEPTHPDWEFYSAEFVTATPVQ